MILAPLQAVTQLLRSLTPSWLAKLSLRYEHTAIGTVLKRAEHEGPLRVQKALYPEGQEICHSIIIHPPAGIAGGDELDIQVDLGPKSHVVLSTPSATKWYKSFRNPSKQVIQMNLGEEAKLDWLPQENLFFAGAHCQVKLQLKLPQSASFIGWDTLMLGRKASGEAWHQGEVHLLNRIERNGKLLFIEQAHLNATDPYLKSSPQMGSWPIMGQLWALGPNCGHHLLEDLAPKMPWSDHICAGVTYLQQGVLLLRVVSDNIEMTRALLIDAWTSLRPHIHGVVAKPLRLWAS